MYDDAVFADRFRYPLAMFGYRVFTGLARLLHAHIAYEIDTSKNHRRILPNFLLFVLFHTVVFNRLPCPNDKTYDDMIFANRFRYQLTMFEVSVLLGLSRLLDTHTAYEIVI